MCVVVVTEYTVCQVCVSVRASMYVCVVVLTEYTVCQGCVSERECMYVYVCELWWGQSLLSVRCVCV